MSILSKRLGEISLAENGLLMKIIAISSAEDVDIQFQDGVVVKHKKYGDFQKGSIRHPEFSSNHLSSSDFYGYKILKRLGIVKDGRVFYLCKDKEGNEHILTPQMIMEKEGIKKVF